MYQQPRYKRPTMGKAGAIALAAAIVAGCAASTTGGGPRAAAQLEPTRGNTASGRIEFVQQGDRVLITGTLSGLKPGAEHGFHVHEKGDCSAADGMSAGGHFNPGAAPHGRMGAGAHHAGDMPNIRADARGVAKVNQTVAGVALAAGANGATGRAIVVHRDADDYSSALASVTALPCRCNR